MCVDEGSSTMEQARQRRHARRETVMRDIRRANGKDVGAPQRAINTPEPISEWRHLRSTDPTLLNHLANAADG